MTGVIFCSNYSSKIKYIHLCIPEKYTARQHPFTVHQIKFLPSVQNCCFASNF